METLLINEQFVSQFKYWRLGQIRTGMTFRNNLFECISKFNHNQRHQAFDLAWKLGVAGKDVIVTVSPTQYTVWGNLRTADQQSIEQPYLHQAPVVNPFDRSTQNRALYQTVRFA